MKPGLSGKIWIAMSTPFQVNFFYPLIKKLENEFDFLITARNHDRIFSMLDAMDLDYVPIGRHGGPEVDGKLRAYAENIQQFIPVIKKEKPDLLLTERWPEAVRTAFGFNIPAWTIFYDEREYHVNRMVFPLSSKVFTPTFYSVQELCSNGVDPNSIVWFRGFHTCYLKGHKVAGGNPFLEKGYKRPIVLVRPEPEFASFFNRKERILEETVSLLSSNSKDGCFTLAVFPRTENQMRVYEKYPVTIINDAFSENPVLHADLTIGAAETMLMEAFVLGKPSVSTVYWDESKPLKELHRHIPHTTDPKEAAAYALKFLDSRVCENFRLNAEKVVSLMENPLIKIEEEIRKFYGGDNEFTKTSQRRRSQIEIYMCILRALAFRSLKLTHIMQEANLSYMKVKKNVALLKQRGLIEEQVKHDGDSYFRATPEGLAVLSSYEKIEKSLF
ncbi:MAG: DUF354 domain-containing protein [Candidatus Bathyarchaeia archaeon]